MLYTAFMPLLLWGDLQWWTFLVASLITMLLAGIDNIGIMIEVCCPATCCLISDVSLPQPWG